MTERIALVLIWLLVLAGIVVAFHVTPAFAHSWYDGACCSDKDCAPIPREYVTERKDGYEVHIPAGGHPLVDEPLDAFVPYGDSKDRRSHDANFHGCISAYSGKLICLYSPVNGF